MHRPLRLCFFSDTNFWRENNFSDKLVLSVIISVIKTTQLTTQWQVWQLSQPRNKTQTRRDFLWCWMWFSSKTTATQVFVMQAGFLVLLSKLNVAVNKVMHTLATCNGLPLNSCSCCLKGLNWKIFLPSLGHCMPVALWCSGISWKSCSVQLSTLSFLRPAPHFTVKHYAYLILLN